MKKKQLICLALALLIIFCAVSSPSFLAGAEYKSSSSTNAPTVLSENGFEYRKIPANNPTRVTIIKYTGSSKKVIIPEKLGGLPVEIVSVNAFDEAEKVTSITLPSVLAAVSGNAFSKCTALKEILISSKNKRYVSLNGVLYEKDTNPESPDYGKPVILKCFPIAKTSNYTIPYGIKTIGSYAFYNCYNLTKISMHNTVTKIEANAFGFCWSLESIKLSDNLDSIGDKAFANCDSLRSLAIPSTVSKIGTDAFLGGIDSDNNKFYYFTDGVFCEKGGYAYDYLVSQHLPLSIIKPMHRTITDIESGITLTDAYSVLPKNEKFTLKVKAVSLSKVEALLPTRYSKALAFDITILDKSGNAYTPDGYFILSFPQVEGTAPSNAIKIYQIADSKPVCVSGAPNTPFVGAQVTSGGRFAVVINNDFSLPGDADGDGIITVFDAKIILFASTGLISLSGDQAKAANADGSTDGKITTKDVSAALTAAAKISA